MKSILKSDFSQKNISKFKKHLKRENWEPVYNTVGANNAFSLFQDIINTSVSKIFPEKMHKITYENRYPWMSNSLRQSIREKNSLSLDYMLAPTNQILKNKYKAKKSDVSSRLRNDELRYISNQLELNKSDLKKSWKIIKDITGLNNNKSNVCTLVINKQLTNNNQLIANEFNGFFCDYRV